MKKIIILIIFITFPLIATAQLTGDGTYSNPWSGTLDGNANWSGTNYINGDIIVDNEKLTISPGATIIFLLESVDLIITGTGQLEASGTQGSMIRFTSDDDNDGNYGETGERWGHISFQSMGSAGSSLINYCIIEFGYKDNGIPGVESFGGAVYVGFSDLTISNCLVVNNYGGYGGGIFIKDHSSPTMKNLVIKNNTGSQGGGGIFIHSYVNSKIINCLISGNRCNGAGGGGGIYLGPYVEETKIINSTISNNTSLNRKSGDNIALLKNTLSQNPVFLNSIIWGSDYSVAYANQTPLSDDFINCAIQNPVSGSTTGCFILNASNLNVNGPNFVSIDGTNWLIQPWSHCVDLGDDTDSDVPDTDFLGNSRIGQVDAGAYESQFYKWEGDDNSTPSSWNVAYNWNSETVPSGNENVYIPTSLANYPTSATSQDYTIGSDKQMIIEPGARVTLNNLTNNGTLKLNHNSSGFASLILSGYSRGTGGTEEIQLYLTGGGSELLEDYKWHYISTPVSSLSADVFTDVTIDLAQFVESRPSTSLLQGWVAYDGYVYSTGATNGPTFSSLTPGKGYNFWGDVNYSLTFGGQFNTSNVIISLPFTYADNYHGFNLLGNPFSSGLNWDDIVDGVYFTYPLNTSKGLYFTRNNVQCTYIGGVGVPGDVNGIIPPMQGFFTKTFSTGNTITLPAAARTHSDIHPRYKGSSDIPLVRLQLSNDTADFDETVVRFDEEAKTTFDNDFDAVKMFISESKNQIYTSLAGTDYAINGQPFPLESSLEVPAVIEIPVVFNVTAAGTYKISSIQLQGLDPGYNVTLIDNTTGFIADLKTNPDIAFSSGPGTFKNRFKLTVSLTTGIEKPESSKSIFNIYPYNGMINIVPVADDWIGNSGSVNILDITGKYAGSHDNIEFQKNTIVQLPAPEVKGLYFLEIKSGLKRYVGKVIIK